MFRVIPVTEFFNKFSTLRIVILPFAGFLRNVILATGKDLMHS